VYKSTMKWSRPLLWDVQCWNAWCWIGAGTSVIKAWSFSFVIAIVSKSWTYSVSEKFREFSHRNFRYRSPKLLFYSLLHFINCPKFDFDEFQRIKDRIWALQLFLYRSIWIWVILYSVLFICPFLGTWSIVYYFLDRH